MRALARCYGEQKWAMRHGKVPPGRQADLALGQNISAAPGYVDGVLIVGLSGGDSGVRRRIVALDAATGRRLWQFFTIHVLYDVIRTTMALGRLQSLNDQEYLDVVTFVLDANDVPGGYGASAAVVLRL